MKNNKATRIADYYLAKKRVRIINVIDIPQFTSFVIVRAGNRIINVEGMIDIPQCAFFTERDENGNVHAVDAMPYIRQLREEKRRINNGTY